MTAATFTQSLARQWPVWLVASAVLVLPFGRWVEAPVLLMALLGLVQLARSPASVLREPRVRLLTAVFVCAWLPMLASLPDAVNLSRTAEVVLNHLRFWLSGLFIVWALSARPERCLLARVFAFVVAFWVVDALVQYAVGVDLFGYKAWPGRLGALFGSGNSKFGLTLAVFAPLLWHHAWHHFGRWVALLAIAITLIVVLLAGSRAAWVVLFVAIALWLAATLVRNGPQLLSLAGALLMGLAVVGGIAYTASDRVQQGVNEAIAAFGADPTTNNNSIVHRFWIWGAGARMIRAHAVNGVGARGFRYAYSDFAREDDPFLALNPPQAPTHSHQLIVEILAETGLIGLIGLVAMVVIMVRAYRQAGERARRDLIPMAAGLAGAYFPINTHLAIYSAYWSQILWLLIAVYCATWFCDARSGNSRSSASASAERTRDAANHSS